MDPSNDPAFSPSIRDHGIACKTIFDCTVPYDLKDHFHRARFIELDPMVRVLEASNKTKGSVERLGLSFYLLFVGERSPE